MVTSVKYLASDVTLAGARDTAAEDGCVDDDEMSFVGDWTSLTHRTAVGPVTPSHTGCSLQNYSILLATVRRVTEYSSEATRTNTANFSNALHTIYKSSYIIIEHDH